jgi:hypothetical protein
MTATAQSLLEKARELLAESDKVAESIEVRRLEISDRRDAEIAAVRDRFAPRIEELDEEIRTAERLRRAITPPERKTRPPGGATEKWVPSQDMLNKVLAGMAANDVHVTSEIAAVSGITTTTVKFALDELRRLDLARQAGTGPRRSKLYELTPAGIAAGQELNV